VVAERDDSDARYLVKWEGVPYAECTWETQPDVSGVLCVLRSVGCVLCVLGLARNSWFQSR